MPMLLGRGGGDAAGAPPHTAAAATAATAGRGGGGGGGASSSHESGSNSAGSDTAASCASSVQPRGHGAAAAAAPASVRAPPPPPPPAGAAPPPPTHRGLVPVAAAGAGQSAPRVPHIGVASTPPAAATGTGGGGGGAKPKRVALLDLKKATNMAISVARLRVSALLTPYSCCAVSTATADPARRHHGCAAVPRARGGAHGPGRPQRAAPAERDAPGHSREHRAHARGGAHGRFVRWGPDEPWRGALLDVGALACKGLLGVTSIFCICICICIWVIRISTRRSNSSAPCAARPTSARV
jgi:hypothetical protein